MSGWHVELAPYTRRERSLGEVLEGERGGVGPEGKAWAREV